MAPIKPTSVDRLKVCDPMAYYTEAEWPGIQVLEGLYPDLPPGGHTKEVWDGAFNPEELIDITLVDSQFNGDPRFATLKVSRSVTHTGPREKFYPIKKEKGAKLIINCLFVIIVKNIDPRIDPGAASSAAMPTQPSEPEDYYLDLDVYYDNTLRPHAMYRIYDTASGHPGEYYIILVNGNDLNTPYKMTTDGNWVEGCRWWGRYDGPFDAPDDRASTYCGGPYGEAPGEEDWIVKVNLKKETNQDIRELNLYQSRFSGNPQIDGGPVSFDNVSLLAQSKAVSHLYGIEYKFKDGDLNKTGAFYFANQRKTYVRFHKDHRHTIAFRPLLK